MPANLVKLRLIEALSRTDGSKARTEPRLFLEAVDIMYKYVIQEPSDKPKRGRPRKADKV